MTRSITAIVMVAFVAMANATTITIDKDYTSRGDVVHVDSTGVSVKGMGNGLESARAIFQAATGSGCRGMCYEIKRATFSSIGTSSLTFSAGNDRHTFKATNVFVGMGCVLSNSLVMDVSGVANGTDTSLSFDFELEISNNCDDTSISFKEAADASTGFQYGDAIKEREMSTYMKGLGLGLALAFVWLCFLIGTVFFLRFCPEKRHTRHTEREPEEGVPLAPMDAGYVGKT